MSASAAQEDLYTVLGVARTASSAEIQAAYFRNVRRHPPEKDAEGFRRIQSAYDVLRNDKTRKEYDDTQRTDPEARVLFDQGRQLLEDGKVVEALPLIKRALVRQPDSAVMRDLLTQALMEAEQYEEAEKQAHRVLALEPENPAYSVRIGDILRVRDHDAEALPYYRKAVFFDRTNAHHVVKLAYLLNYLDRTEEAIKILEDGIQHDGKVDFDDFIYFDCLYTIFTLRERYADVEKTRDRIRKILPPDQEQRSFVAWFYYQNALRMAARGSFEAAVRSIEEAGAIDSSLPDLAETLERFRNSRALLAELQRLGDDKSIETGLGMTLVTLGYRYLLGHSDDLERLFDMASDLLDTEIVTEGVNLRYQLNLITQRYPALAELLDEVITKLRAAANAPKRYVRLICPNCGNKGRTDKPTVESMMENGLSYYEARALLDAQGERGLLSLLRFTCEKCGTTFNGLSERAELVSQTSGGSGCFVVTASCGDENAYPVRVLRAYRDRTFTSYAWGRFLIRVYNRVGPVMARVIARSPRLRALSRDLCERIARRLDG